MWNWLFESFRIILTAKRVLSDNLRVTYVEFLNGWCCVIERVAFCCFKRSSNLFKHKKIIYIFKKCGTFYSICMILLLLWIMDIITKINVDDIFKGFKNFIAIFLRTTFLRRLMQLLHLNLFSNYDINIHVAGKW